MNTFAISRTLKADAAMWITGDIGPLLLIAGRSDHIDQRKKEIGGAATV